MFKTMEVHLVRFICAWMVIHSSWASTVNVQPLDPTAKPTTTENLSRQARDSSYYRDERPAGRCITCAYAYDRGGDRDRDRGYNQNYYYYRPGYNRGYGQSNRIGYEGQSNRGGYEGQSNRGGYEDRNWYYQPDLYDDRNRYGGAAVVDRNTGYYDNRYDDRYMPNRYDDRYNVRPLSPSSQYDTQYGPNYRGNGYDNTDPNYYYEQSRRDPYGARERPYSGYDRYDMRGYNREYDGYRQGNRGVSGGVGYDQRNFRPWDESYRGTSGFDNSGRGYYFANKQAQSPHHSQPPPQPFRPSYTPTQNPPTQQQHNNPNHHPYESSSSSGNKGSYNNQNGTAGDNSIGNRGDDTQNGYANSNDRNNGQNYRKDQDAQSAPYGSYERPLRGSYLFERDSDSSATETTDSKAPETKSVTGEGETKQ